MKKILYVILGLLALYLVLGLFGPSHIKVERSQAINAPAESVKQKIGDFKFFHDSWSPWTEKDPNMKTNYTGNAGEIGHHYDWDGNKDVGKGSMELVRLNGDSLVEKLHFDGHGDSKAYYIVNSEGAGSKVTWGMEMTVGYFFRPMMLFMNMDKMMGGDFEKGLGNLKNAMEAMPADKPAANYDIEEQNWDAVTYVGKKETVSFDKMEEFFGANFQALYKELAAKKITPESKPSGLFTMYDKTNHTAEVAAVAKVPANTKLKNWETFSYPASKVLHIAYYGSYDKSTEAHDAMDAYMKEKGVSPAAVIEEYVTDPMTEKDTAKWLTNIYYILK